MFLTTLLPLPEKLIAIQIIEDVKIASKRAYENGDRLVIYDRILNKADSKKTKCIDFTFFIITLFSSELVRLASVQGMK